MKGESAISSWQLAVLLFLSRVMQFFLAAPQNEQPGALTAALLLPGLCCGKCFAFAARLFSAPPASG